MREALAGVDRYQGFKDALGISDHTLSRRLTHLQDIGILTRDPGTPTGYSLTEAGEDLAPVLAVMGDWAMRWLPVDEPLRQPPDAVRHAAERLGLRTPGL